jgi:hypothetical protein
MTVKKNTDSIVKKAYLLIRCLAMEVLLLSAFASAGICIPSRCLAMGIHVTISVNHFSRNFSVSVAHESATSQVIILYIYICIVNFKCQCLSQSFLKMVICVYVVTCVWLENVPES